MEKFISIIIIGSDIIKRAFVSFISFLLICNNQQNLSCSLSYPLSSVLCPISAVHRISFTFLHTSLHLHLPPPILNPFEWIDLDISLGGLDWAFEYHGVLQNKKKIKRLHVSAAVQIRMSHLHSVLYWIPIRFSNLYSLPQLIRIGIYA